MATPYIYIITAPNKDCYVGQSIDMKTSVNANVPYKRLYQHAANAYYNTSEAHSDASVSMFRSFALQDLYMKVYELNDDGYFGLPKELYQTFLQYFTPKGKEKVKQHKKGDIEKDAEIKQFRQEGVGIYIKQNNQEQELSQGLCIDIAEIIWISRYQARGYNILNKVMGGQRASWEFKGVNGTESVNITTSTPSQITSMLWSTEMDVNSAQLLRNMQIDFDRLLQNFLNAEMGNLIKDQILNDVNSRRNLFNPKIGSVKELPLKSILETAITRVLSNKGGTANANTKQFKKDLYALINKYEKLGLNSFGFNTNWSGAYDAIAQGLARNLASSLLGAFQNKKMDKKFSVDELSFNIVNNVISFKGSSGRLIGNQTSSVLTVNLDQTFNLKNFRRQDSWWYNESEMHGHHVSDDVRWRWAKNIFHEIFLKVRNSELGLLAQSQSQPLHTDGVVAVVEMSTGENTLNGKMREYYMSHLKWSNRIFKYWNKYFSRLYSIISQTSGKKQQWSVASSIETQNTYAILSNQEVRDPSGEESYVIGFQIGDAMSFDLTTNANDHTGIVF